VAVAITVGITTADAVVAVEVAVEVVVALVTTDGLTVVVMVVTTMMEETPFLNNCSLQVVVVRELPVRLGVITEDRIKGVERKVFSFVAAEDIREVEEEEVVGIITTPEEVEKEVITAAEGEDHRGAILLSSL
jgi:hypothetical protein